MIIRRPQAEMELYYVDNKKFTIEKCIFICRNNSRKPKYHVKTLMNSGKYLVNFLPKKTIFYSTEMEATQKLTSLLDKKKNEENISKLNYARCTCQGGVKGLKNGEIYRILAENEFSYKATDGIRTNWYSKKRFVSIGKSEMYKIYFKNIIKAITLKF